VKLHAGVKLQQSPRLEERDAEALVKALEHGPRYAVWQGLLSSGQAMLIKQNTAPKPQQMELFSPNLGRQEFNTGILPHGQVNPQKHNGI
jgi:hypothetical protein